MLLSIVASYAPPLRVRFSSDLAKRGTNGRGAVLARVAGVLSDGAATRNDT